MLIEGVQIPETPLIEVLGNVKFPPGQISEILVKFGFTGSFTLTSTRLGNTIVEQKLTILTQY